MVHALYIGTIWKGDRESVSFEDFEVLKVPFQSKRASLE